MSTALFRFNIGPKHGAGHMSRCLALAEMLEARGYSCICAVNADGLTFLPDQRRAAAFPMTDDHSADIAMIAATAASTFDLAVFDHYGIDRGTETKMRRLARRLAAIDDLGDRDHDVDVLIDTAPGQAPGRYTGLVPVGTLVLQGTDYAMLRSAFVANRRAASSSAATGGFRILVALGAVDSRNVTCRVLEALAGVAGIQHVTAVLGRSAPHVDSVRTLAASLPFPARLIEGVDDMAGLILQHDLGIGAPGVSAFERACLGLPQALIQIADNQAMVGAGLAASGSAVVLGSAERLGLAEISTAISNLLTTPDRLQRLGAAGRATVDGRGAERVAAILIGAPRDQSCRPLAARRIRSTDADILYRWQTDASTRRFFLNAALPTKLEHERFIASRIAATDRTTEMIVRDGLPVAIIRTDPGEAGQEVSIVVAPECRGQGIGRAALGYLDALAGARPLTAVVDRRNAASLALFTAAGYGENTNRRLRILEQAGLPGRLDPRALG